MSAGSGLLGISYIPYIKYGTLSVVYCGVIQSKIFDSGINSGVTQRLTGQIQRPQHIVGRFVKKILVDLLRESLAHPVCPVAIAQNRPKQPGTRCAAQMPLIVPPEYIIIRTFVTSLGIAAQVVYDVLPEIFRNNQLPVSDLIAVSFQLDELYPVFEFTVC